MATLVSDMKQYYEAYVTMTGNRELLRDLTKSLKWKFSAIDGDANLGDGGCIESHLDDYAEIGVVSQ